MQRQELEGALNSLAELKKELEATDQNLEKFQALQKACLELKTFIDSNSKAKEEFKDGFKEEFKEEFQKEFQRNIRKAFAKASSEHKSVFTEEKKVAQLPSQSSSLAQLKQELDAAFEKLKKKKNSDGSYAKENGQIVVQVENEEDEVNAKNFQRLQALYLMGKRLETRQSSSSDKNFLTNAAALGVINYTWTNGMSVQNALIGAGLGTVHLSMLRAGVSKLRFWGKTCAVLGAVATPFKVGLGFDLNMLAGAEVGMLIGEIIDGLGDWGKMGLKIGLVGGLFTYGLALEAVLLAGGCLAAAGSVLDTAEVMVEKCRRSKP